MDLTNPDLTKKVLAALNPNKILSEDKLEKQIFMIRRKAPSLQSSSESQRIGRLQQAKDKLGRAVTRAASATGRAVGTAASATGRATRKAASTIGRAATAARKSIYTTKQEKVNKRRKNILNTLKRKNKLFLNEGNL
jgi:hypothetical protein